MQALINALGHDDVSVRLDAISRFSSVKEAKEPLFKKVSEDFSRDVREAGGGVIDLCPSMFALFLADPDPQVRIAVINKSLKVRDALGNPISVISSLSAVARDSSAEVRCALAKILHLHADLPNPEAFTPIVVGHIVPLIGNLVKDLHDDVRVAASLNLRALVTKFGFDIIFEYLHNTLHGMLTDTQWRVRNNAVELLFQLALVCSKEFFNSQLFPFLLLFLRDPSNRVREYAVKELPTLAQHFGDDWLKTKLVIELQNLAQSPNFLHRQTYLWGISELVDFFPVQYQSNYVFQPLIRMLRDPIHNVVLLALHLLAKHHDSMHPFQREYELFPILKTLAESGQATVGRAAPGISATIRERASRFLTDFQT
jgi:serine/threonine-protein phosphatase 2A regulatory subunit A